MKKNSRLLKLFITLCLLVIVFAVEWRSVTTAKMVQENQNYRRVLLRAR